MAAYAIGMMKHLVLVFALVTLPGVEATPIPRDLKPDFSSMTFALGTWHCTVDSSRRPRPFATTATTSISPDGYWLITRTITGKVPWNPITITTTDDVTYDRTTSRWIDVSMDDYGAYDVSASPGWNRTTIVWTELVYQKLHGLTSTHQRTLSKVSATKTVLDQAFAEGSGKRVTVRTTCTKA
ncbi:MAG: hypothetical protein WBD74_16545 [Candidatus Aquilonibacter sp.]